MSESDLLSLLLGVTINLNTIYTRKGLVAPVCHYLDNDSIKEMIVVCTNSKILMNPRSQGFMNA